MITTLKTCKAITIFAFLLLSNISFGQTKEETISWLKEKLIKCIDLEILEDFSVISIDECKIVINYRYKVKNGGTKYQITLPTDVENITNDDGVFRYKAKIIIDKNLESEKVHFSDNTWNCLRIAEREENIRERIVKAMKHLATFCPKKKETF